MKLYEIFGMVLKSGCSACASNLRIEAWDADCILDDLVGSTQTNSRGEFFFKFTNSYYEEIFTDRDPDLYFKVYRDNALIKSTENEVLWNVRQGQLQVRILLNKQEDPDCCSDASASSLPLELLEGFIPLDRFQMLFSAISKVAESDSEKRFLEQMTNAFKEKTCQLDLILSDARDFSAGSMQAGTRLGNMLNTLLYFPSVPSQRSGSPTPTSLSNFPFPPQFRFRGRNPCLFFPERLLDIFFAIERFKVINPQEIETFQQYQEIIHREVAKLAPFENIFVAATEVLNESPWANDYFKKSLMCFGSMPAPASNAIPLSLQNFALPTSNGGEGTPANIQPIRFEIPVFDRPLVGIDLCRAERWARTEEAMGCWSALRDAPHYSIADIYNTSKSIRRRACVGDRIEIRGNNLGTRGKLSFGRRIEVEPEFWTETLIAFEVPPLAEGKELRFCVDPELTACVGFPSLCRLPASGTSLALEVIRPITDAGIALSVSGPSIQETGTGQFTAEACTPITLTVRVLDADNANVTNDRGDVVWTLGDGDNISLSDDRNDTVLTLSASNLCNLDSPFTRTIRLDIQYLIHAREALQVDVSVSARIELRTSCPVPDAGLPLNIRLSDISVASLGASSVTVPPGSNSVGFLVEGLQTGFSDLVIEDASGLYEPTTVRITVAPVITDTSPIRNWINEPIAIAARGLVAGNTSLLFPGSASLVPARVVDESATATIPEFAENGRIHVVVTLGGGEIRSDNSVRLRVNDPEISDVTPAVIRRRDNMTIEGRGFSMLNTNNAIEMYRTTGRRASVTPDSSAPRNLTFSLPEDSRFANNSLFVTVAPLPGVERSSDTRPFEIYRQVGSFRNASFGHALGERSCGENPIIQVDDPRFIMSMGVDVQVFPYQILNRSGLITASGDFRIAGITDPGFPPIGGITRSHCCDQVAVLSYNSGAFTSASRFNLIIYDVETGRNLIPSGTIVNSTSGSGMPDGSQEPRIYFSPDCTIAAVLSKAPSGRDSIVFYDLERSGSNIIDRVAFSIIAGFTASVNDANQIEYSINGENQLPIDIE